MSACTSWTEPTLRLTSSSSIDIQDVVVEKQEIEEQWEILDRRLEEIGLGLGDFDRQASCRFPYDFRTDGYWSRANSRYY